MIELKLPDMTCGHCVQVVTRTVQAVDAQARVDIDLAAQRLRIESTRDEQAFKAALAEEGYPAA
jgi:copper chaperone